MSFLYFVFSRGYTNSMHFNFFSKKLLEFTVKTQEKKKEQSNSHSIHKSYTPQQQIFQAWENNKRNYLKLAEVKMWTEKNGK